MKDSLPKVYPEIFLHPLDLMFLYLNQVGEDVLAFPPSEGMKGIKFWFEFMGMAVPDGKGVYRNTLEGEYLKHYLSNLHILSVIMTIKILCY